MDIRVLKYFVQVAKDHNFTRAAEHLYISQPALSKMIKKLESELGVPLFDIRTTGVYLTDFGEQLYQRVIPIISDFDSLSNFAREVQTQPTGILRVGVTPMLATLYMVDIFTEFNHCWPEIKLQIVEDGTILLRKSLLNGEIDIALCITGDEMPGLHDTILFEDIMVAVVSKENPLSQHEKISFSQLKDEPFNLYSKSASLSRQITDQCIKAGFMPKVNISSSKVNFMLQMTERNRGVTILPRPYALRGQREELAMIPFKEPFPWQGCLVYNGNAYRPYVARLFEDFVLQYFEEHH